LAVLEKGPPNPHDSILRLDNVAFIPHYASYAETADHEWDRDR
jgi:lactate dehydrogenase-like 2-hydroxyacid dehydrogenase